MFWEITNLHLQVCFATCFDSNILADLQACEGKLLRVKPTSADVVYRYFHLFFILKDVHLLDEGELKMMYTLFAYIIAVRLMRVS